MNALWQALRETGKLFGPQRKLWVPFLIGAVLEIGFLGLIWLAPHPPFSKLLAPPIRYFFSENVLHYPAHLWFLYHVMKHAHFIGAILLGAFMTGIASEMVRQARLDQADRCSLRAALLSRHVRYGRMVVLWVVTWGAVKVVMELVSAVGAKAPWLVWPTIGLVVILQALLVYAIPIAVFTHATWWKALWESARENLRHPLSTFIIVAIPSLVVIGFAVAVSPARVARWMAQTAPEVALVCVALRLAVLTVADTVMSVAVAHLWWIHRAPAHAAHPAARATSSPLAAKELERGPAVA